MHGSRLLNDPPITEPVPVADTFATWMRVDQHADYVRFMFFADHPMNGTGEIERQVVGKVVMPRPVFEKAFTTFQNKRKPS